MPKTTGLHQLKNDVSYTLLKKGAKNYYERKREKKKKREKEPQDEFFSSEPFAITKAHKQYLCV